MPETILSRIYDTRKDRSSGKLAKNGILSKTALTGKMTGSVIDSIKIRNLLSSSRGNQERTARISIQNCRA